MCSLIFNYTAYIIIIIINNNNIIITIIITIIIINNIYIVYMVYRFVYASLTIIGIHGSIPRFQPCLKTQGAFSWRHSAPPTGNEEQQAAVCCSYP